MSRERSLCGKEEIIKVAIDIVDREGMEALSARRIAKELGVSSMTIYNYVKNLNDVKKRVLIAGFDRLYNSVYQSLIGLQPPVGRRTMCPYHGAGGVPFRAEKPKRLFVYVLRWAQSLP